MTLNSQNHPAERRIRAQYTTESIRVYQAFSDQIADSALTHNRFISPPFNMNRMTWIKPSFLWMMYRSGWGKKDDKQKRILAIDISHDGFLWALSQSCPSSFKEEMFASEQEWLQTKAVSPVRVQWDPERTLTLEKLDYRAIQIGLSGQAVQHYTQDWIINISEVTSLAQSIKAKLETDRLDEAKALLPTEQVYDVPKDIAHRIGLEI